MPQYKYYIASLLLAFLLVTGTAAHVFSSAKEAQLSAAVANGIVCTGNVECSSGHASFDMPTDMDQKLATIPNTSLLANVISAASGLWSGLIKFIDF